MTWHYKRLSIEPLDVMPYWLTNDQLKGFYLGNVIKYIARFNAKGIAGKGGLSDLMKAQDYLGRLIDLLNESSDQG